MIKQLGEQLLSVIIPMYNEEENVENTIAKVASVLNETDEQWELIVVNDGSTDSTPAVAEKLTQKYANLKVCHHPRNLGPGRALRTGFMHAKGDAIITIDADLSYDPKNIPLLINELRRTGADIILASPYSEEGKVTRVPLSRLLISRIGNFLLGYALKTQIKTLTGIFRAYRRSVIECLDLKSDGKEIEPEIVAKALSMGFEIQEIPMELRGREVGVSKFKSRKAILAHLKFSMQERPMILFSLIGLSFFILGSVVGLYLLYELFSLKIDIMRPSLILGVLLMIIGVQTYVFGFIADQLSLLKSEILRNRRELREK